MGRWGGHRMFEGDQDREIPCEIADAISGPDPCDEFDWIFFFAVGEADKLYPDIVASDVCKALDSGFGDKLFDKYRSEENTDHGWLFGRNGKYIVIVLGAMMMRVGAKIREKDMQHLREIATTMNSNEGFTLPLWDDGFRGPGKRQFLAALDHYQAGTPRSFAEPSCFACGKIAADIGRPVLRCSKCVLAPASFCDKDCQRAYWKHHKSACGPRKSILLNV